MLLPILLIVWVGLIGGSRQNTLTKDTIIMEIKDIGGLRRMSIIYTLTIICLLLSIIEGLGVHDLSIIHTLIAYIVLISAVSDMFVILKNKAKESVGFWGYTVLSLAAIFIISFVYSALFV